MANLRSSTAVPSTSTTKIPATIVTGFLGAGKTTLIRHLIAHSEGRRLALIVNEFGELGFDGELLKGCASETCRADDIVELANGCICCTVADDFLPTMEALLARAEPPDHIVIETSGLALPKPLVQAFDWPSVRTRVTVDGVVAVIDAEATAAGRFATDPALLAAQRAADPNFEHDAPLEELFHDQLACADLVVLTKTDLLDAAAIAAAEAEIQRFARPGVRTVRARFGELPPSVLLGLGAAAEDDIAGRRSVHDGQAAHDHDDFDSFWLEVPPAISPASLVERLKAVAARHDILRIKGFAAIEGKPMRLVIQGVGARFGHHFDRAWAAGEAQIGRLVVIGLKGLDQQAIRAELAG
jgi:cobalamin biosynthesis protein CobW